MLSRHTGTISFCSSYRRGSPRICTIVHTPRLALAIMPSQYRSRDIQRALLQLSPSLPPSLTTQQLTTDARDMSTTTLPSESASSSTDGRTQSIHSLKPTLPAGSPRRTLRHPTVEYSEPCKPLWEFPSWRFSLSSTISSARSPSLHLSTHSFPTITHRHLLRDILREREIPTGELGQYRAVVSLVRALIGIPTYYDSILSVHPPTFTTYYLLVPNLINAPFVLCGLGVPTHLISLSIFHSARATQAVYASAHCENPALRTLTEVNLLMDTSQLSSRARLVVKLATKMSSSSNGLSEELRQSVLNSLSPANVEWAVLSISMNAFLTTFMNAIGFEGNPIGLEGSLSQNVSSDRWKRNVQGRSPEDRPPWRSLVSESFMPNLMLLRHAPSTIMHINKVTSQIPKSWPAIGDFLSASVGYSFPILGRLCNRRATRAIAEAIRLNLDGIVSGIDPNMKYLVGMVYAAVNGNQLMLKEFKRMAQVMIDFLDKEMLNLIIDYAKEDTLFNVPFPGTLQSSILKKTPLSDEQMRVLFVAKASAHFPSRGTVEVVEAARGMRAEHTVELVCWVSVLAMLHKLYVFYYPTCMEQTPVISGEVRR